MPSTNNGDWERRAFQSHYLNFASYSPSARILKLTFANGYESSHAVPPALWDKLKSSPSPGSFYRQHIQGVFPDRNKIKSNKDDSK